MILFTNTVNGPSSSPLYQQSDNRPLSLDFPLNKVKYIKDIYRNN